MLQIWEHYVRFCEVKKHPRLQRSEFDDMCRTLEDYGIISIQAKRGIAGGAGRGGSAGRKKRGGSRGGVSWSPSGSSSRGQVRSSWFHGQGAPLFRGGDRSSFSHPFVSDVYVTWMQKNPFRFFSSYACFLLPGWIPCTAVHPPPGDQPLSGSTALLQKNSGNVRIPVKLLIVHVPLSLWRLQAGGGE